MKSFLSIKLTVLLVVISVFKGYADDINTITTAVPFLLISPDARAGSLGDAGVSSRPDINSMHWNPAKYAFMDQQMGVSVSYTPWLRSLVDDINLSYLAFYRKLDELQTIAFTLRYFSLGQVAMTSENAQHLGYLSPNEFTLDAAYARILGDHLSGAIAARFIYSDLTQGVVEGAEAGVSVAADVAIYYNRPLNWDTPTLFSWGLNISNMGNKISYTDGINADFIPINLRLGPSLNFELDNYNEIALMLDFNKLLVPTPPKHNDDGEIVEGRDPDRSVISGMLGSFTDAPGGFSEELNEITISAGAEYWYDEQFALRAGYFHEHESKGNRKYFTFGLGLKYNVFGLDFSYLVPVGQRNPLENSMRFSLLFDMENLWEN